MGSSVTTLKPVVINKITTETVFNENEARDLYRLYRHLSIQRGKGKLRMGAIDFLRVFVGCFPEVDCQPFAELVFNYYDKDRSGDICFREFLFGLNEQLKTDSDSKVSYAFNLMDKQHSGVITFDNVLETVKVRVKK